MNFTPDPVVELKDNEIFVFGSNLSGIHGSGAAYAARVNWGAEYGVGIGLTGRTYAIPTKDENVKYALPLAVIKVYIDGLYEYVVKNPNLIFVITKIGCGLAGYKIEDMAPLFEKFKKLENVTLPKEFYVYTSSKT